MADMQSPRIRSKDREAILKIANGSCPYCGISNVALQIRHIIPISKGGSSDPSNLEAICPNCNFSMENRPSELQFVAFLADLLEKSDRFKAVSRDPVFGIERLRPDLIATEIIQNNSPRELLIECKSFSTLLDSDVSQVQQQLSRYGKIAPNRQLVLAFPGKATPSVLEVLQRQAIEIWDIDRIGTLFADEIEASGESYYGLLFRGVLGRQRPETKLVQELKNCPAGLVGWSTYQKLIGRILELLFCPPLTTPFSENADYEKINRRDFVFPNYASEGFWLMLRQRYGADYILVDAKNGKNKISKAHVLQVANYLKAHGVGMFAIIVGRLGADRAAKITIREQWLMHSKLIVVLSDDDLEKMLLARSAQGDPSSVLGDRIQQFRLLI